jgi:hypothetical protein
MKVCDVEIGKALLDMHNGCGFEEPHRVVSHIVIDSPVGHEFISKTVNAYWKGQHTPTYTNKYLVVLDVGYGDGKVMVKCGYSYDARRFGLVEIEVDTK